MKTTCHTFCKTILLLSLCTLVSMAAQCQSRKKVMKIIGRTGDWSKGYVNILPYSYDSTITTKLLKTVDTLPRVTIGKVFGMPVKQRIYYLTWPTDSTRPAISALKCSPFQRLMGASKYYVTEYNDSGRFKRWIYYDKNFKKSGQYVEFYGDWQMSVYGYYKNDIKVGKWRYYNEHGFLTRVEEYEDGKLVSEKAKSATWEMPFPALYPDNTKHYQIFSEK